MLARSGYERMMCRVESLAWHESTMSTINNLAGAQMDPRGDVGTSFYFTTSPSIIQEIVSKCSTSLMRPSTLPMLLLATMPLGRLILSRLMRCFFLFLPVPVPVLPARVMQFLRSWARRVFVFLLRLGRLGRRQDVLQCVHQRARSSVGNQLRGRRAMGLVVVRFGCGSGWGGGRGGLFALLCGVREALLATG